jgi:hypothetical protein
VYAPATLKLEIISFLGVMGMRRGFEDDGRAEL